MLKGVMTVLKMFIADDEQFVIDGLKYCLEWSEYGIEIVGEGNNGQEALDFIQDNHVDIIITDMKMPIMDGMELIKNIRKLNLSLEVLILSGYEDFEYARSAIQYGVFEYLLKPVTIDKIERAVEQLVDKFRKKVIDEQEDRKKTLAYEQAVPYMEEKIIASLIKGQYNKNVATLFGIDIKSERFAVAKIQLDKSNYVNEVLDHKAIDLQHIIEEVKKELYETLKKHYTLKIVKYDGYTLILIFLLNRKECKADIINKWIKEAQEQIKERLGYSVTAAIGNTVDTIENISQAYNQASEALEYKMYYGDNSLLVYRDLVQRNFDGEVHIGPWKKELTEAIAVKDLDKALCVVDKIFEIINRNNEFTIEYVRQLSMEMFFVINTMLSEQYTELESIYTERKNLFKYIMEIETLNQIKTTIQDVLYKTVEYLQQKNIENSNNIIANIKSYIEDNLNEEISLERLSEEVYLTPNYIGHIFKEEVGISYLEYLTQVRIEKAKNMLMNPTNKIYEISERVGYKNSNYFSKLFRKYTGYTPSQYRKYHKN